MDKSQYKLFLSGLSPWIILGAALVLLPVVALMTVVNINRQKEHSIRLLMEKGAALIRSFEAGTRMGMRGGHGRDFKLQQLLVETAAQPDIAHLLVVRSDGTIIAHSRTDWVGRRYGNDLDLEGVYQSGDLKWRRSVSVDDSTVFEVYGKFAPLGGPSHRPMHRHRMSPPEMPRTPGEAPSRVIFVGLRTDAVDAARAADTRHTIVIAMVLLLVGCSGVLLLFLAHHYRSTRTSLMRVQAFSDDLVSRIPIGLVALDKDAQVTAVNSVAAAILDINVDAVIGRPAGDVLPTVMADILAGTQGPVEKEVRCPLPDGRRIPMDVNAANLIDTHGGRFGQVILFKDLTEIHALRRELEESRRLATVGRLAAGVAHEIRNPLSSIKGFATYFKEKYQDVDNDQEIATILIQEVDRLNRVVGQLLDFSRPIRLHAQHLRLRPFFQDVFRVVEGRCHDGGVGLTLDMPDDSLAAQWDADKMSQVMLNLLLNALDAMPDGGDLTVCVAGNGNNLIRIAVEDTGVGIRAESRPHIFEPYFSTKPNGTGLGLAIVHNIIKAHRGDILVINRSGGGTAIQITLPITPEV